MAISVDTPRSFVEQLAGGTVVDFPVGATEVILRGSLVSSDAGYASPLAGGEVFLGVALEAKTGGASDADNTVKVQVGGVVEAPVTSVAITDIGKAAYATDDGTIALATTSASGIGKIIHVPATGTAWIALKQPGELLNQAASAL